MTTTLPLSDLQKGILFELQQFQGNCYYTNQELLYFNTSLEVPLLQQALHQLVAKYEILRSAILFTGYHPQYVIYETSELPFTFYDYSNLKHSQKLAKFSAFIAEDFAQPLDINQAPLMRIALFKFATDEYRLVWDIHHIIIDGASVAKIIKDLFLIYSELGKNPHYRSTTVVPYYKIDPLPLNTTTTKTYWQHLLNNHTDASLLPCNSHKTTTLAKKNIITLHTTTSEYHKLVEFTQANSLSMNSVLQAAWAISLAHYSNNENITFGSVRAYPHTITQNQVGLFINTLPMSFTIDPQLTIIAFLHQVRTQGKHLRNYATTPLSQIYEWVGLTLDTPIYQTIINYEPFSLNKTLAENFPELPCKFSSRLNAPYPLILEVVNHGESLQLDLNYDSGMFTATYMESYLNHYQEILRQFIATPNKKLVDLSPATGETLNKVVYHWNNSDTAYPLTTTIHQLFEAQVEKNPKAPALVFATESLTYRMLNNKANQLAHLLLQQGIAPEERVVIWLKTSMEMIIAVLAVLKAGGAFIPLDTNNPIERVKYILEDSKPKFILSETMHLHSLTTLTNTSAISATIINLEERAWDNYPTSNPKAAVGPTNLAYLIYTSGSTGKPKGSLIEHFSVINMALGCGDRLKISPSSRVLQIAAFSFDAAVMDWGMTLLNGATLYLIAKEIFSPQKIIAALAHHKITAITASHSIIAALPQKQLPHLKVIAPGGEPLDKHTLTFWGKERLLLNVYGITETTVASTMAVCTPQTEKVTIGKPLSNVKVYILNKYLQPLPPGVSGELYIGGYGVGRGYWNNSELTQKNFIPNPFTSNSTDANGLPHNRLYKTGDLGQWTEEGEIELRGRIDDQVKIRGFRIELKEIEHVLTQYPGVKKAIVLVKELEKSKQLLGYILPTTQQAINIEELQKYLSTYLPSYMLPTQIIQIAQIPLTAHGKIDKEKLLKLNQFALVYPTVHSSASTDKVTEKICSIIKKMLQLPQIPTDKNLLEIGLDSIMLVELSLQLSSEFKQKIDITTLFTYTTIDKLASFIKNRDNHTEHQDSFRAIKLSIDKRNKY